MAEVVEIPDDTFHDSKEEKSPSKTNNAFYELRSLRTEMEFQGSVLSKSWCELSRIMGRYQAQLVQKHELLDSSLSSTDRSQLGLCHDDLKRSRQDNNRLQKLVCDIESKILAKDSEIVNLRTEVHKLKNEVMMKENLIQKIQGQMAEESMDYQNEITSLRDMLEAGQADYNVHPVITPKRRKITTTLAPRSNKANSVKSRKPVSTPPASSSGVTSPPSIVPATPIKTDSFRTSCQMAGPSLDQTQQNEMDSSFTATDQSYNELQDSSQEQNFIKMDEVYEDTDAANIEGLMQEQDPNMFLESAQGQEQIINHGVTARNHGVTCSRNADNQFVTDRHAQKNWEYRCIVCMKEFKSRVDLGRHHRTHSGVRPWQCLVCSTTFATKGNAKNHVLKVHNPPTDAHVLLHYIDGLEPMQYK